MVTANGIVTRIKAGDISCQGRPATGVRAQNLTDNDTVVSVNKIVNTDNSSNGVSEDGCPADDSVTEQTTLIE